MRKLAIVVVSALVGLMFAMPAAGTGEVTFVDPAGDVGHPVYMEDMTPAAYWPVTSPVGSAGYLDMLGGWMSLDDDGLVTAGLTLASGLTDESTLPNGVKAVWWTWFLYLGTGYFEADYAVHFCWDGASFSSMVVIRGLDDPVGELSSWTIAGDQIVVEFDSGLLPGAVAWFAEAICWNHSTPGLDQGRMPSGGWFAADISPGPFLPWLPMPT